jgi:hypothetical protein
MGSTEPFVGAAGAAAEPFVGGAGAAAEPFVGAAAPEPLGAAGAVSGASPVEVAAVWGVPGGVPGAALAATALAGVVLAPDRGAVVPALGLSPRPSFNIQTPATPRPMSINKTRMIKPHGRCATIGIDSDGSSSCDVRGRGGSCLAEPFGGLEAGAALPYWPVGALLIARGGEALDGTLVCCAGGGPRRPALGCAMTWPP